MQHRYVGDVGDFGKLGLLRTLLSGSELRLGVAWYLVPNEAHNDDGKHVTYLKPQNVSRYKDCDPPLLEALARIIDANARSVGELEQSGMLPANTRYHSTPLSFDGIPVARRKEHRARWMATMLEAVCGCDIVFVDPDNGLECSIKPLAATGPKYVFVDDLAQIRRLDVSLVIYHHLGRNGSHPDQIASGKRLLAERLNLSIEAMRFRRGTSRVFFIAMAQRHEGDLRSRLERMVATPWGEHFERH